MTISSGVGGDEEAAFEFHRDGALTFRGLESAGIIDRGTHSTNGRAIPFRPVRLRRIARARTTSLADGERGRELDSSLSQNERKKRGRLNWGP